MTVVYIIDNGGIYSDHALYFVEPKPEEAARFEELLGCVARAWPRDVCQWCGAGTRGPAGTGHEPYYHAHRLVAKVTEAEWHRERCAVVDYVDRLAMDVSESCRDVAAARSAHELCRELIGPGVWVEDHDFQVESGGCRASKEASKLVR